MVRYLIVSLFPNIIIEKALFLSVGRNKRNHRGRGKNRRQKFPYRYSTETKKHQRNNNTIDDIFSLYEKTISVKSC